MGRSPLHPLAWVVKGELGDTPKPPPGDKPPAPPSWDKEKTMDRSMVTTTLHIEGMQIVRHLGIVRGITVRSRSVVGQIGASFQQLIGGNITLYTELCEHAREEAFVLMMQHAETLGANAILGMRYDANEITDGVTEVLAYGTAVVVQPR